MPAIAMVPLAACAAEPAGKPPLIGMRGETTIRLQIKVVPASSRNCIAGWLGDTLKIRVTAPAERGKANAAVETTVAEALDVPKECIRIVTGHTSARKTVEIIGLSEHEVHLRLSKG